MSCIKSPKAVISVSLTPKTAAALVEWAQFVGLSPERLASELVADPFSLPFETFCALASASSTGDGYVIAPDPLKYSQYSSLSAAEEGMQLFSPASLKVSTGTVGKDPPKKLPAGFVSETRCSQSVLNMMKERVRVCLPDYAKLYEIPSIPFIPDKDTDGLTRVHSGQAAKVFERHVAHPS